MYIYQKIHKFSKNLSCKDLGQLFIICPGRLSRMLGIEVPIKNQRFSTDINCFGMKGIIRPLMVGLVVAGATWSANSVYGQNATTAPTLQELQVQLVELQTKMQETNPANQALISELSASLGQVQGSINAILESQHKAPEQPLEIAPDHSINTTIQVADPNWVPSFISTGDPAQDAAIIHQYKVSKGLEKDGE